MEVNPWSKTPIKREEKLRTGEWIDITHHFLGEKAKSGVVHIACSLDFHRKILRGSMDRRIDELRKHLKDGPFEMRVSGEVFECQCIRSIEQFNSLNSCICYTFFNNKP